MATATFTVSSSGSTATDGTTQTLVTDTTLGAYQATWDLTALQNGDAIELSVYVKTVSGSTAALAFYGVFSHARAEPVVVTPIISSAYSIAIKMKLVAGSNRTIDWRLDRY